MPSILSENLSKYEIKHSLSCLINVLIETKTKKMEKMENFTRKNN